MSLAVYIGPILFVCIVTVGGQQNLVFSFNSDGNVSNHEWARYRGKVPRMEAFTICHWQYLAKFNFKLSNIYAYCYKLTRDSPLRCVQMWQNSNNPTGGRKIDITIGFGPKASHTFTGLSFNHKSWIHVCWTFDKKVLTSKVYLNGVFVGNFKSELGDIKGTFEGSDNEFDYFLVLGQEPDEIMGVYEYDAWQSFRGKLMHFNVWDKVLPETLVKEMATCKQFPEGNIIAWKIENFIVNKAKIESLADLSEVCQLVSKLYLFPYKKTIGAARQLCSSHGGIIFTPQSEEQNRNVVELIKSKTEVCMDSTTEKMVWLGFSQKNSVWYDSENKPIELNYTNWLRPLYYKDPNCAALSRNGLWEEYENCLSLELCTVCKIQGSPVLTFKGLCHETKVSWNFYLDTDKKGNIYYDGFKNSKIVLVNGTWTVQENIKVGRDKSTITLNENESELPIGRKSWRLFDPICPLWGSKVNTYLTMSKCIFPGEFTCNNGGCISIYQRCNGETECLDGSDETNCKRLLIPKSYDQIQPPEVKSANKTNKLPNPINTEVIIINVDKVDTVGMLVQLTLNISLTWREPRLTFFNVEDSPEDANAFKNLKQAQMSQLWEPLSHLVFLNAVIGEIVGDSNVYSKILIKSPPEMTRIDQNIEELLYPGSTNDLVTSRRFKATFHCKFWLQNFPFDRQVCHFILQLMVNNNQSVMLFSDGSGISYIGPERLNEFAVTGLSSTTSLTSSESVLVFTINFQRLFFQQLVSTYFQTFILWGISYLTLYIDPTDFTDRFMGAITALLVFAALLSSLNSELPKVSYLKHIDLWFMWYIINIFAIIVLNVVVDVIQKRAELTRTVTVSPMQMKKVVNVDKKPRISHVSVNRTAKMFFLCATLIFNIMYFILSYNYTN